MFPGDWSVSAVWWLDKYNIVLHAPPVIRLLYWSTRRSVSLP